MTKNNREPLVVQILLVLMIFEVPFFKLFLIAATLIILYLTVVCRRRLLMNRQMFILTLFIVSYFAIDTVLEQSTGYKIWYILSVVFMYAAGFYSDFSCLKCGKYSLKIRNSIALIAKTYFCYVFVSIVYSIINGQFEVSRNPLNLWTGSLRAATHYGTMLVIPVAYGIVLLVIEYGIRKKLFGAFLVICAVVFSIMTASRTILYFVPIGLVCGYYFNIKITGRFERKHLNQILFIVVLIILGVVLVSQNAFNLQTMLLDSQLGQRYIEGNISKISEDGRMKNILFLFSHLTDSLWGGGFTRLNSGNLHNIYLNVYDLAGVVPFLLLVLFSFGVLRNICRLFRKQIIDKQDQVLVFVFYVLTFIQLLMEPVMESVPVFFYCLLYISGMIEKCSKYNYLSYD